MVQIFEYCMPRLADIVIIAGSTATGSVSGQQWACQGFKIGASGANVQFTVTEVRLGKVNRDQSVTTGELIIEIRDADKNSIPVSSAALCSGSYAFVDILSGQPVSVAITSGERKLNPDKNYVFIAKTKSNLGSAAQAHMIKIGTAPGAAASMAYPAGYELQMTGIGDKEEYIQTLTSTLAFEIRGGEYAGTLCTVGDVIHKAGKNSDTTARVEQVVSNYVLMAEAYLANLTRVDWVAKFSTLNANINSLLTDAASSIAAIYVIQAQMSSYTSRVEAETMINTLRDQAMRALALIVDQNTVTYLEK